MDRKMSKFWGCALGLLWGSWWTFFSLAATITEPGTMGQKFLVCLGAIVFFAGSALLPLWKQRAGGGLLLAEGAILCVANFTGPHSNRLDWQIFLLLTLALPPLTAGMLLLRRR